MRALVIICCLLLAACSATALPTRPPGPTRGVPTGTPDSTATTTVTPIAISNGSPAPTATIPRLRDCPAAPPSHLIVHERGQVVNGENLNLRRGPGTNYDIVTGIEPGEVFWVLDGPACAGAYTWYRVRYATGEVFYEGWIAEGDFEGYYVAPYLPG